MPERRDAPAAANRRFRARPPEVEAIQFLGTGESCTAVGDFLGGPYSEIVKWNHDTLTGGTVMVGLHGEVMMAREQWAGFSPGCWIVKQGTAFSVLRDEDFRRLYEEIA